MANEIDYSKALRLKALDILGRSALLPMKNTVDQHIADGVHSQAGAHGIRYHDGVLQYGDASFTPVTPQGSENPMQQGWYVYRDGIYRLTTDTQVVSGTTYFTKAMMWTNIPILSDGGLSVVNGMLCVTYDDGGGV